MRDCTECQIAQGDECVLFTGNTCTACALVTNTWYKVDDLISKLECAAINCGGTPSTTTTTTTTTAPAPVTLNISDQGASAGSATFVLMPGAYNSTPGSGGIIMAPPGTYTLFITGADTSGDRLEYRDSGGNVISNSVVVSAGQSVTIPAIATVVLLPL